MLKNRLDLNFSVSTVDAYSKFRALKILKPTTELTGKYTCLVTSLAGQDSKEQVMTVLVDSAINYQKLLFRVVGVGPMGWIPHVTRKIPAHEFRIGYMETNYDSVNVSCETLGVFPYPNMRLYLRPSSVSPPCP
ncbi:uncharacterized protein CEXT_551211 [Caerostris extrusa]|uniref:Uncharacterized protein n=1 Tax=Caerostris extrusa TaxID=172846 RepID=A0AAV4XSE6_CAEEX|nr:uncharacterized protein CEXT_551211 [Caerostris extrusa]